MESITSAGYWQPGRTQFPIPSDLHLDSTTDPQLTVSRAYDVVSVPMDDGVWHITLYCPATLDPSHAGALTGVSTAEQPCQPVEITVGGQRPFWLTDGGVSPNPSSFGGGSLDDGAQLNGMMDVPLQVTLNELRRAS